MASIRRMGLAGTELEKAQVGTILLKRLKIGARRAQSLRPIVPHRAPGLSPEGTARAGGFTPEGRCGQRRPHPDPDAARPPIVDGQEGVFYADWAQSRPFCGHARPPHKSAFGVKYPG